MVAVSDDARRVTPALVEPPGANSDRNPSLGVHLLAGLPTEAVRWGFERAEKGMTVVPLHALADAVVADARRIGVLLPPFAEPSLLVESWEECGFLPDCLGRAAHLASVSTFVDLDHFVDHLASTAPLSLHGWGQSDLDVRTIADILVGQIESATHLVLVGETHVSDAIARCLTVLNPGASRTSLPRGSGLDLPALSARSVQVVPPWLEALHSGCDLAPRPDLLVYRRARPFDPKRFVDWLANPPRDLSRGKGHVWLASEPDRSFGYSCAGSVHRLFPGGRWWASLADGAWPGCDSQRRRLLERWHPRFGDRRQELVFTGVDLDCDRVCSSLDACLLPEERLGDALHPPRAERSGMLSIPRTMLH